MWPCATYPTFRLYRLARGRIFGGKCSRHRFHFVMPMSGLIKSCNCYPSPKINWSCDPCFLSFRPRSPPSVSQDKRSKTTQKTQHDVKEIQRNPTKSKQKTAFEKMVVDCTGAPSRTIQSSSPSPSPPEENMDSSSIPLNPRTARKSGRPMPLITTAARWLDTTLRPSRMQPTA